MIKKAYCENVTMINNEIICDRELSLEALGFYNFLMWANNIAPQAISLNAVLDSRKIDFEQGQKILKELEEKGYIDLLKSSNLIEIRVYNSSTRRRWHLGD